jgi:2-succinyl-6-hydroxy-2,4-cyclohexadiene-1-carboxylate synthase
MTNVMTVNLTFAGAIAKSLKLAGGDHLATWPYVSCGQPDKPTLVLLHGFMGRGEDWLPLARRWLAPYFFCVMPTLPGHGTHIPADLLTFDTVADGLYTLVQQVTVAPVNLLGYSMGGRLALYFAHRYSSSVNRVVLEGASPGISDPQARTERARQDDQRAEKIRQQGMEAFVHDWYQMDMFATLQHFPQKLAQLVAVREANNPAWAGQVISQLSPGRQPDVWPKLQKLSLPLLLVAGEYDHKYKALSHNVASLLPRGRVIIVEGAGHNTHVEQPERFAQSIIQFLLEKE